MNKENAISVAVAGLAFLANDTKHLARFLGLTGINPDELRQVADSPEFLAGVLEYLQGDEPTLLEFSAANALDPDDVGKALSRLAGSPAGEFEG